MHPFPSPLLLGKQASFIGYVNDVTPNASTWDVPFPIGTQVGDMLIIAVSDNANLTSAGIISSGAPINHNFSAGPGTETNLRIWKIQVASGDFSSGVQITNLLSTVCKSVFTFRGPSNIIPGSYDVVNAGLPNGSTVTLAGFTQNAQHVANLAILMSKSNSLTCDPTVPWQSSLLNGSNSSLMWQVLDGRYAGQNIEWFDVQNMSYWCAISEDLYR